MRVIGQNVNGQGKCYNAKLLKPVTVTVSAGSVLQGGENNCATTNARNPRNKPARGVSFRANAAVRILDPALPAFLDIVQPSRVTEPLAKRSRTIVLSLERILASKLAANRPKDRLTIPVLRDALATTQAVKRRTRKK